MSVTTVGYSYGAVTQASKTQVMTFNGSYDSVVNYYASFMYGLSGSFTFDTPVDINTGIPGYLESGGNSNSETTDGVLRANMLSGSPLDCDRTHQMRAHMLTQEKLENFYGSTLYFKTYAIDAVVLTPSASSVTYNSATIACDYYVNTNESLANSVFWYKKATETTWTVAANPTNESGYGLKNVSVGITGLSASTTYQIQHRVHQFTANDQIIYGPISTFTTSAATPTVTTYGSSYVSTNAAYLTGNVNPNGSSTTYWFEWGTTTAYGNSTAAQGPSGGTSIIWFGDGINGLVKLTTYHFRAVAQGNSIAYGADDSFTTPDDPQAVAAEEDHMHIYEYEGKYGVQSTFYFTLQAPAATSSDRLVTTAPASLFAAGDIKISIDGGSFANATNSVVQAAASNPLYSLVLTAAEMTGTQIMVQIVDQNGPAFRDAFMIVKTKLQLGQIDVDATQIGGNTPGMTVTGVGTGAGLIATGGATAAGDIVGFGNSDKLRKNTATAGGAATITLDANASAVDNYYAGSLIAIVSGTGAGQSRVCASYVGTTKVATVTRSWATNPASGSVFVVFPGPDVWSDYNSAELTVVPGASGTTATYALKMQFLFQRFAFKLTQTATTQTWFKADSSTSLATRSVSDDGTTQTTGKLS